MMPRKIINYFLLSVFLFFLITGYSFAQRDEEKAEKTLDISKLERVAPTHRIYNSAGLFFGYDSNVRLSPERKGALFEEAIYSLGLIKPIDKGLNFTFNYDLDYLNYNDIVSATNFLNHLRLGMHKRNYPFQAGSGYDFSYVYYPHDPNGDFFFHKGFLYLRSYFSRRTFQEVFGEYGYKPHVTRKAMGDTIGVLQDKELEERRQVAGYRINSSLLPSLNLNFLFRFSKNESNARYLDFYDYKSYEFSPSLNYRLSAKTDLTLNFIYMRKDFKTRTITSDSSKKQKDDIYAANLALRYKLNKNSILSLIYGYRDDSSNESLEKYNENIISIGCQYNF